MRHVSPSGPARAPRRPTLPATGRARARVERVGLREPSSAASGTVDAAGHPSRRRRYHRFQRAACRGLARALALASPFDATHLACEWALSAPRARRLALAHALAYPVPVLGALTVLQHLAADADPEVRHAARCALTVRAGRRRG